METFKLPPGFPHSFLGVTEGFVKNVCISDVATGLIFLQKVYKWKESSAFNNLGEQNEPTVHYCTLRCHGRQDRH